VLFLIEYDRNQGKLVKIQSFSESDQPIAERTRLELELELNRNRIEHEVVLLEAIDEKALRRTHRRYFEDLSQLVKAS
jgi:hypothetical protein